MFTIRSGVMAALTLGLCLGKPRVFQGLSHSEALFRVPLKEPFD